MAFGSASLFTARLLGFGVVAVPLTTGSAMRPTALGVGVAGGGGAVLLSSRFRGVVGAGLTSSAGADCEAFLFRDLVVGGGGISAASTFVTLPSPLALKRVDLRAAILVDETKL